MHTTAVGRPRVAFLEQKLLAGRDILQAPANVVRRGNEVLAHGVEDDAVHAVLVAFEYL